MLLSYLVMHFLHFGIALFIRKFDKGTILSLFPDHVVRVHIHSLGTRLGTILVDSQMILHPHTLNPGFLLSLFSKATTQNPEQKA